MIKSYRPTGNHVEDHMVTTELYETFYEIHDHVQNPLPLGLVRVNAKENYRQNTLYDNFLRDYMNSGVLDRTGVTFETAMELPYPRFLSLLRVAGEKNKSFKDMVKIFIDLKIFTKTGLSFGEYSRLSYRDMSEINEVCSETIRKENKVGNDHLSKLEDGLDGVKGL